MLSVCSSAFFSAAVSNSAPLPADLRKPIQRVRLLHFSDYHSHAVPFFSEHQRGVGGIARALAYVKQEKAADPGLIVLGGGDMWNAGTPAWSDKYFPDCADFRWWNGLLTAMALGNHDVDYGWDALLRCRQQLTYPVVSGNLVDGAGNLLLAASGKPYLVEQRGGVRIGLFALSGPDFAQLVNASHLPARASFSDSLAAARRIVKTLRVKERVDAVIFFGHQDRESDFAMARQVPGIDLILGTHSHYKGELQRIPGTKTYFISPFQYLNYLSQVELRFAAGKLIGISGQLLRLSPEKPEDQAVAAEVARMQQALEADPRYAPRFQVIGAAAVELMADGIDGGESVLGDFVLDTVRTAAAANAAFSTASSFRQSIPPGPIRLEDYLAALPYTNKLILLSLTGAQVKELVQLSIKKRGSDNFAVTSGLRYTIACGKAEDVFIATDLHFLGPKASRPEALREDKMYTIVTTDFMVHAASGYKELFAKAATRSDSGLILNDVVLDFIRKRSPVAAHLDGRITDRK